nr:glycosyl hydrolase-related protein [Vibrio mediterranei]
MFLNKNQKGAVLSVLKKAEDEDALILRVYNPSETATIEDNIAFNESVTSWREVSMDERIRDTNIEMQSFGSMKPCQARSFQIKL